MEIYRSMTTKGLIILIIFLTSCASVHSRTQEHITLFQNYSPQIQKKIQAGEIEQDFSEEMVYMAKGSPSEKIHVKEGNQIFSVWNYNRMAFIPVFGPATDSLSSGYGYPVVGPGPSRPAGTLSSIPYFSVWFQEGKVVKWEASNP